MVHLRLLFFKESYQTISVPVKLDQGAGYLNTNVINNTVNIQSVNVPQYIFIGGQSPVNSGNGFYNYFQIFRHR